MSDTAAAGAASTDQSGQQKRQNPVVVFRDYLVQRADSLRNALPPHIKPERFIASVLTAVQINPDLLACDRRSLFLACMRCAQDGLLPDGTEAAIVPYKKQAQYIAMYQGLLKKFRNSGQFKWVSAGIVYVGDVYEHWIDETGEHFKHVPGDDTTGKTIRRVYALATTKDGGSFINDMSLAEVNKRQAMSRASREDAPWRQWPDEMRKKTALRGLSKLLPKSSDLDAFLKADEDRALGVEATEAISDQRGEAFGTVLDHFAETGQQGDDTADSSTAAQTPQSAAVDGGAPQGATGGASTPAETSPAGTAEIDVLRDAFRKGQEAKAAGHARRAMPGEYRDGTRSREALCWQAGYDGDADLPTFGDKK